ncbi:MAG: gliding motility-associated ABC transporter ATP-binding subunit GldA [Bacteroidota bacterium]
MSLEINHLTKVYGKQIALNAISFSVQDGEIVGFLGPNGAGKSTTMKISTGFLPSTSGDVKVGDFLVSERPLQVKRIVGYLAEHNPLYLDMYVHEHLRFVGGLYGLSGSRLKHRVGEMIELCGLTHEQNKKIETLSKGYRQRVGLAQALIHDPKVLILDEPTSGLDPNQIVEIRKLIKEISVNKTVVFSTHIMQEVQAICDRVIVINKGEIVADDKLVNLLQIENKSTGIEVEFETSIEMEELRSLPFVKEVVLLGRNKFRLIGEGGIDIRPEIFKFSSERKISLLGLKKEEVSLESVFRELTHAPSPDA